MTRNPTNLLWHSRLPEIVARIAEPGKTRPVHWGLVGIPSLVAQTVKNLPAGISLIVQWLRHCAPNTGGLGLIPGQGIRSHMQQLKILHAATETHCRKINKNKYIKKKKESACNLGDPGSIPGSGRSSGEGNGNLLQYSCLENSMDRGACWGHRVRHD